MPARKANAMDSLNASISHIAKNIVSYRKQPQDFTRNSKLKVMLNMQGNSLNAELQEAFPDISERMTASAYVQARDKLSLPVFEDLLSDYNQSAPKKLFNGKYRLYAIDGSDFTTPWNPKSAFVTDTLSLYFPRSMRLSALWLTCAFWASSSWDMSRKVR